MSLQNKQLHKQFLKEYNGLLFKFDCEIKAEKKGKLVVEFNEESASSLDVSKEKGR